MSTYTKRKYVIFVLWIVSVVSFFAIHSFSESPKTEGKAMKLLSSDFEDNGFIPTKYSCKGDDVNPTLSWDDIPEGTKSFALSVKDPDAPSGTFIHWLVYDIDESTRKIDENSIPGKQVKNSFGKENYGGPCPPSGVHRYYFRLFALDSESLGDIENSDDFDEMVKKHTIEEAELMGKFEK